MRKKSDIKAVHLVPSDWTWNAHTAAAHTLLWLFLDLNAWMGDTLPKSGLILSSSIHIIQALPSAKSRSCTHSPPHQPVPGFCSNPQTSTDSTVFYRLQRKQFHILRADFQTHCTGPQLKSTFTGFHLTASTCMFTKAGWMVNKRWTCSRIKTLKWLTQQHTLIPHRLGRSACNQLLFHFYWRLLSDTEKKDLKQNKTNKQQKN